MRLPVAVDGLNRKPSKGLRSLPAGLRVDQVPLDAVPDAVIGVDRDGVVVVANCVAEVLFGYEHGTLVGQPVERLLPSALHAAHKVHREGFFDAPRVRPMHAGQDLRACRRDGGEFAAQISLAPLHGERGLIAIAAVRDTTGRRRAEREREETLEDLREAQRMAQLGSWRWDPGSGSRVWSSGMFDLYGRDPAAGPMDADQFWRACTRTIGSASVRGTSGCWRAARTSSLTTGC